MDTILKQMNFSDYLLGNLAVRKDAFKGRASIAEFWTFTLFYLTAVGITFIVVELVYEAYNNSAPLFTISAHLWLFWLKLCLISVSVRRLHDINTSGAVALLLLIPIFGLIIVAIPCSTKGTPGENKYGPPIEPHETKEVRAAKERLQKREEARRLRRTYLAALDLTNEQLTLKAVRAAYNKMMDRYSPKKMEEMNEEDFADANLAIDELNRALTYFEEHFETLGRSNQPQDKS